MDGIFTTLAANHGREEEREEGRVIVYRGCGAPFIKIPHFQPRSFSRLGARNTPVVDFPACLGLPVSAFTCQWKSRISLFVGTLAPDLDVG